MAVTYSLAPARKVHDGTIFIPPLKGARGMSFGILAGFLIRAIISKVFSSIKILICIDGTDFIQIAIGTAPLVRIHRTVEIQINV